MSPDTLPNDIASLKAMLIAGREQHARQLEQQTHIISEQQHTIDEQQAKLAAQEHKIAQLLRQLCGPKQERIHPDQLLLFGLDEIQALIDEAKQTNAEDEPEELSSGKKNRKGHGRRRLPKDLPREQIIHELSPEERICPCCGELRLEISRECSEQLDYIPAQFKVIEHVRLIYGCEGCESHLVTAPKPPQPIEKGFAAPGLLAYAILAKYGDHTPLYRIEDITSRFGSLIRRSTLCGWVADIADLTRPIYDRMCELVRQSEIVNTDDTSVKLLVPGQGHASNARFWAYIGDEKRPYRVFDFTPTRERAGPEQFLDGFAGYLQADAYGVYDGIYLKSKGGIQEVACWAHDRRYWWDARDNDAPRAHVALGYISRLYEVERNFESAAVDERAAARRRYSRPILDDFKTWLDAEEIPVLPKSVIGKAFTYTLNQWDALCRYIERGDLCIDNNIAEQTVKIVAIGRKNWLFVASETGGDRAAVLFSLIASCKANQVEPYAYLRDVIKRLPTHPSDRIDELLPDVWLKSHPEHRWKIDDVRRAERKQSEASRRDR